MIRISEDSLIEFEKTGNGFQMNKTIVDGEYVIYFLTSIMILKEFVICIKCKENKLQ